MRFAILVLLAGCLPVTQETVRSSSRTLAAAVPDRPGTLVVHTETYDGLVVVTAGWPRQCRHRVVDRVETTRSTTPRLVGTENGSMWGWFAVAPVLVIVWPVGLADLAITLGAVVLTDSSPRVRVTEAGSLRTPCFLPARAVTLHLTLPSGARVDGTTDDHGRFALVMPVEEPIGNVTVTTDGLAPPGESPVAPTTPNPPVIVEPPVVPTPVRTGMAALSYAAVQCAARLGLDGTAKLDVTIAADGAITRVETDRAELTPCLRIELATARFPTSSSSHTISIPFLLKRPR